MATADAALALVAAGVSHCSGVVAEQGGLLTSLFITGLVGGISHCIGMCGPFVLSQVGARLERIPARKMREWHRLTGAALLPYQLGRMTTYAVLGALGAALAGQIGDLSGLRWLSAALLLLAAVLFLGHAVPRLKRLWAPSPEATGSATGSAAGTGKPSGVSGLVNRLARPLFSAPLGWRGYGLGVVLGFIPCGLLYAALAAAAATGDPVAGAFGMMAFCAGTIPNLFAVGVAGHWAGQRWRGLITQAAPVLLVLNAGVLGWLGLSQLISSS